MPTQQTLFVTAALHFSVSMMWLDKSHSRLVVGLCQALRARPHRLHRAPYPMLLLHREEEALCSSVCDVLRLALPQLRSFQHTKHAVATCACRSQTDCCGGPHERQATQARVAPFLLNLKHFLVDRKSTPPKDNPTNLGIAFPLTHRLHRLFPVKGEWDTAPLFRKTYKCRRPGHGFWLLLCRHSPDLEPKLY